VLPDTARVFGRAVVMPNLVPPVTTAALALAYRDRIVAALPGDASFAPLMTAYLTDTTSPDDLSAGFVEGVFVAAKLYPAGATTNAESGVTDLAHIHAVLDAMQRIGMPLLVHGEVVDAAVDVFDREAVFVDRVLTGLRRDFPELNVVFEHVTTDVAVQYVESEGQRLAATVTPHHLVINRNAMFAGGIRPHMYCLPVAKRERHRLALRRAATSGDPRFFIGTDSAPHLTSDKESACGCAGIYNAPAALGCYAQVFEEERALDKLEAFLSLNGPRFYRLEPNDDRIVLRKNRAGMEFDDIPIGDDHVRVFSSPTPARWRVAEA
jgi:dihydroorotase